MVRRQVGADKDDVLIAQGNLANTYQALGRNDEALSLRRDVYSGQLKLLGKEHRTTLIAANNYAASLEDLKRFKEIKALLLKAMPVARRVLERGDRLTLKMRKIYAKALFRDPGATLNDLHEAVTTLEEIERNAWRLLGGAHPLRLAIEDDLKAARLVLSARESS